MISYYFFIINQCMMYMPKTQDPSLYTYVTVIMLLIHKDISHMPITELENDSESVWVKVFANKTSHFVASWYRPPGGDLEMLDSQLKSLES